MFGRKRRERKRLAITEAKRLRDAHDRTYEQHLHREGCLATPDALERYDAARATMWNYYVDRDY